MCNDSLNKNQESWTFACFTGTLCRRRYPFVFGWNCSSVGFSRVTQVVSWSGWDRSFFCKDRGASSQRYRLKACPSQAIVTMHGCLDMIGFRLLANGWLLWTPPKIQPKCSVLASFCWRCELGFLVQWIEKWWWNSHFPCFALSFLRSEFGSRGRGLPRVTFVTFVFLMACFERPACRSKFEDLHVFHLDEMLGWKTPIFLNLWSFYLALMNNKPWENEIKDEAGLVSAAEQLARGWCLVVAHSWNLEILIFDTKKRRLAD